MAMVNLHGRMESFTKVSLLIIVSLVKEFINGQMEVFMKVKLKMVFGVDMEFIELMMRHIKDNGRMVRSKVKEK